MIRRATPALLALLCLAPAPPPHPAPPDLPALLQQRLSEAGGRGAIIVALLDPGSSAPRYLTAGTANPERPTVDEHTLFEIGSITKTITAYLLADAVARGEVSLDDRLGPRWGDSPDGPAAITLRELATHTSGLPRVPSDAAFAASVLLRPRDPYRDYHPADLDRFLSRWHRPDKRPFAYSNLGYGLLGGVLERASGKAYGDLVRERFAGPLGLRDTFLEVPADQRARVATGHDQNGDLAPSWSLGISVPAGGVRSSAHDLAVFAAALREATSPAIRALLTRRADAGADGRGVGLAMMLDHRHGADLVWHNGGVGGYRSFFGVDRRTGRGVVVLTSTEREITDLGLHLLDPAFPMADRERRFGLALFAIAGPLVLGAFAALPPGLLRWRRRASTSPGPSRLDVASRVLSAAVVLAMLWHLAPWVDVGGRAVRLAVALAVAAASAVALARARRFPWVARPGKARLAAQIAGIGVSAALLIVALLRW